METSSLSTRHSSIGDGTVNVKAKRHTAIQYMHKVNVKDIFPFQSWLPVSRTQYQGNPHACMHTCAQIYKHITHTHSHTHAHIHTHMHAQTYTHTHTTTHTCTQHAHNTHMHTTRTDSHVPWMLQ